MFLPSEHRFRLRRGCNARIGQTALDLTIAIKFAQSFRCCDSRDDQGPVFGGATILGDPDLVAGTAKRIKIRHYLVPVEQLAVGADLVPEVRFRSGNGSERRRYQEATENQGASQPRPQKRLGPQISGPRAFACARRTPPLHTLNYRPGFTPLRRAAVWATPFPSTNGSAASRRGKNNSR